MKNTFLFLAILFSYVLSAQNDLIFKEKDTKPFIEVNGTAEKEVMPDRIYIAITLTEKSTNDKDDSIQKQEENLRKGLAETGVDLKELFLSDAVSEITTYKKRETGIKLSREYTLIVKNADEVKKVFKKLSDMNIKEAIISKTESSEIEKYRKEVRIAAIKVAKEKATYLLQAIGEELGKPLEIKELDLNSFRFSNTSSNMIIKDNVNVETNFEKILVRFSYYIKYSVK
ncbi:SIMPL domain-containing protein [Flavobacterium sp.]|uniref:SIMPL domain-containing protein n=1 Tax=Flavobacterium sp. TaxID=239 RepID=UPI00260BBE84|nr:SIMPL domain-containing protein [Flavobacterium sp.]